MKKEWKLWFYFISEKKTAKLTTWRRRKCHLREASSSEKYHHTSINKQIRYKGEMLIGIRVKLRSVKVNRPPDTSQIIQWLDRHKLGPDWFKEKWAASVNPFISTPPTGSQGNSCTGNHPANQSRPPCSPLEGTQVPQLQSDPCQTSYL